MLLKNEMFYKNTLKLYNTEYFLCSLDIYLAARSPPPMLVIPNFLIFFFPIFLFCSLRDFLNFIFQCFSWMPHFCFRIFNF